MFANIHVTAAVLLVIVVISIIMTITINPFLYEEEYRSYRAAWIKPGYRFASRIRRKLFYKHVPRLVCARLASNPKLLDPKPHPLVADVWKAMDASPIGNWMDAEAVLELQAMKEERRISS